MSLDTDRYTIAWICALPVELAAARALLDEVYASSEHTSSGDPNSYILGRVYHHNVAVACLPSGWYGVASAATIMAHMRSTFPSLQFGLMVGVGGGVPGMADVRLGDVVVGIPTPSSPGVIQYNYGKTLPGGRVQRTGSSNKPPPCLLTAVSQIRSGEMLGKTVLSDTITAATDRMSQEAKKTFSRPDIDWLFNAHYTHQNAQTDCSRCDEAEVIPRQPREKAEPYVHYGAIASGDQVIKDAVTRDAIAQETGALCFEMEAAGLIDQLPCLVIRGICDYCDSHKNKQWQGYAALAAAAYANVLLQVVPPNSHHRMNEPKTHIGHWMVPFSRNRRFTGRQNELATLEERLLRPEGPTKVAIYGLGGVGKTQVALEMAYRMRERDPACSIFWITCTSYASVSQDFTHLAAILGITDIKPAEAKERVRSYLSRQSEKWLLIFDNADDTDMFIKGGSTAPPLKRFLPSNGSGNGSILFTTRNRKLAVKLASSDILSIPSMDEHTAMEMLAKSLVRRDMLHDHTAAAAAAVLLRQLSFLPLAIIQAVAYINANDISFSEYLFLFKEHEENRIELLSEDWDEEGRYEESQNAVATTWWVSFQHIQQLDSLAADFLSFMACINSRSIPPAILPAAPSSKQRIDALGLLDAYSFISEHAQGGIFSLHRLVHLATRNWMRKNKTLTDWVRRTANHLDEVFPDDDYQCQAIWEAFLPHALYLACSQEFDNHWEEYDKLLLRIGKCLRREGQYNEAKALFARVLELRERTLGSMHPHTLLTVSYMGSTHEDLGEYQLAESMHRRALEGRKAVFGLEHAETLRSLSKLGAVCALQGKYHESETMHRQALDGRSKLLGPDHPSTLTSLGKVGSALSLQGKYRDAESLLWQTLEGRKQTLGLNHPDTLAGISQLGFVLEAQGKYAEAENLHRQCLLESEKILGPEHPHTLISTSQLGSVLERQGKYVEAESMHRRTLHGREKALGPDHPDTLASVRPLASVLGSQNKYNESGHMYWQALTRAQTILGPEHPETLSMMSHFGLVLDRQGNYTAAEALHRQVLDSREKILGSRHPETLISMCYLGAVLAQQGRYSEAEVLHRRNVAESEHLLGPENPATLTNISYLAYVLTRQGKYHEAEVLHRRVLLSRHKVLGPDHPSTLSAGQGLARTLEEMGVVSDIDMDLGG